MRRFLVISFITMLACFVAGAAIPVAGTPSASTLQADGTGGNYGTGGG